ncbi:carbohydrate ABC transporter permease [Oenococcus sicerae]|uniref:Sugar ABC transporter permease n=1 Tax=Oenococcus sicerae TaxID=2203724 RepID=A0AAJ1R956_9LACO|nr:sugar ABC transporter permease [Oenococcus sicerae]MDN6900363.1 sugar ABC transporter permease [Oenococcus sicerae]
MAENNRVIDPSGSAVKAARGGLDFQQLSVKKNDKGYAWLFLGPSLLLLIVFIFYPMLKTLYLSLFLTNGNGQNTVFVGLQNYMTLLTSATYFASLFATLIYVLAVSLLTIILGLLLASTASKNVRGSSFFRTIFSSTMGVSISVSAIFWLFIFNPSIGVFTQLAAFLHLPILNWSTDPNLAMLSVIISTVWMNLGFAFLILFSAFQSLPQSLYEETAIEGASPSYRFFHVTLPLISPTLFFVSIITLIESFKSFGLIDLMTAGGPNNATNLLVYHIYQNAFLNGNYSQASAESVILIIVIAVLTFIQFKYLEKKVSY